MTADKHLAAALFVALAASGATSMAQPADAAKPAATASAGDLFDGEIRKVDKSAKKLTIKHGEMKSLDMPPMTMVFQVKDPALLDRVKAGDKVRFKAEMAGTALVVTDIQPAM